MSRFLSLPGVTGGASFLTGMGTPAAALGSNGDTYLDLSAGVGKFWKKAGAAWADTGTNLESVIGAVTVAAWFASLPKSAPATAGQPWNDGNTLAFS